MQLERVKNISLQQRIMTVQQAIGLIEGGMTIAFSSQPYARKSGIARAWLEHVHAGSGERAVRIWEDPYVDQDTVPVADLEPIDIAVIHAVGITEAGGIIPSAQLGNAPLLARMARQVIVEIDLNQPMALAGCHDVHYPAAPGALGHLSTLHSRLGKDTISVDMDTIVAVVFLENPVLPMHETEGASTKPISQHLMNFFVEEIQRGHLPASLYPIQMGQGNVIDGIFQDFKDSPLRNLQFYSNFLQKSVFALIDAGKVLAATAANLLMPPQSLAAVLQDWDTYKKYVLLRPTALLSQPELIRRFQVIAINPALEVDVLGNVNGTQSLDTHRLYPPSTCHFFVRHAALSIFVTNSTALSGKISTVVPAVGHVDFTHYDVDVVVTEYGYADLRGLNCWQRASVLVENCADPYYRDSLRDYYHEARKSGGRKLPHVANESLYRPAHYRRQGAMQSNNDAQNRMWSSMSEMLIAPTEGY
jgi:succinyl-CoA:acetate CoA-transferase